MEIRKLEYFLATVEMMISASMVRTPLASSTTKLFSVTSRALAMYVQQNIIDSFKTMRALNLILKSQMTIILLMSKCQN